MSEPRTTDCVNDFDIKLANVNGTGSASANTLLMKAIFRMGVPVVGKNYFPSNIQGLPTWYEIRVSRDGYIARSGKTDLMVAMNAQSYEQDLASVSPGGYLIYDSTWPRSHMLHRPDITILGVPLAKMCNEAFDGVRARILMKNVAYVGVLAALLDIDMEVIRQLLVESFSRRPDLVESNLQAIRLGFDYAMSHFDCPLNYRVAALDETADNIMVDGNTATALGCLYAGATVGAWYPITPSTSVMDAFKNFCSRYRQDPETGERSYFIVQAEDELAAIGMVLGAGWMGARAFTPTSGPGISLMGEFLGFAYFAEIPAVLINVQRVGPSTGLPTRTQQADILSCAYASHGDTKQVLLFPANPEECFHFAVAAFDLAERLQTPVIFMSDLDIGMNDWACPRLEWEDSYRPDRGKVVTAAELEEMENFWRYHDVDGDGICARSLPGVHAKGSYFARGSGHNHQAKYTESSEAYVELMDRIDSKFETAADLVPQPVLAGSGKSTLGIISVGSCDGAVLETLDILAAEGSKMDYLRVRAFPFSAAVREFLENHERVFVVEQNRDGQLRTLIINTFDIGTRKMESICVYDGLPLSAESIVKKLRVKLAQGAAA
ncbi:MAG: 2-oxoacid:acceptor oxidoreductase subunit alpha [Gammaproteobacteria bacterium]